MQLSEFLYLHVLFQINQLIVMLLAEKQQEKVCSSLKDTSRSKTNSTHVDMETDKATITKQTSKGDLEREGMEQVQEGHSSSHTDNKHQAVLEVRTWPQVAIQKGGCTDEALYGEQSEQYRLVTVLSSSNSSEMESGQRGQNAEQESEMQIQDQESELTDTVVAACNKNPEVHVHILQPHELDDNELKMECESGRRDNTGRGDSYEQPVLPTEPAAADDADSYSIQLRNVSDLRLSSQSDELRVDGQEPMYGDRGAVATEAKPSELHVTQLREDFEVAFNIESKQYNISMDREDTHQDNHVQGRHNLSENNGGGTQTIPGEQVSLELLVFRENDKDVRSIAELRDSGNSALLAVTNTDEDTQVAIADSGEPDK